MSLRLDSRVCRCCRGMNPDRDCYNPVKKRQMRARSTPSWWHGHRVWGLGRVLGLALRVQGLGLRD